MSPMSNKDNSDPMSLPEIPHIPRLAHSYPGSKYLLPSDDVEKNRLIIQHEMLKRTYDGNLFHIPVDTSESYFVLDSGTGGAIWLLDVAQHLPKSAILHGIDIESRLFPTLEDTPRNISFSINSITNLPTRWSDRFDIIHQRMLKAALQEHEWVAAFQEMYRVLKPGGWIQLAEAGSWKSKEKTERLELLIRGLLAHRKILLDCIERIPSMLQNSGFVNIKTDKRMIPLGVWAGKQGRDARDNYIGVFRGMKTPVLKAGGFGIVESEEEFDQLIDDVSKEWDENPGSEIEFSMFTAEKPQVLE